MAKDKALSIDGISDIIIKKSTWRKMWRKQCLKHNRDLSNKEDEDLFIKEVEDKLAKQLQIYYNYCI